MNNLNLVDKLNEEMVKLRSIQEALEVDNLDADNRKALARQLGEIINTMKPNVNTLTEWYQMNVYMKVYTYRSTFARTHETQEQPILISHAEQQTPNQPIQVLNAVQTESTLQFCSLLKTRYTKCHLIILSKADVVDAKTPLLILCPKSSRLKPDVDLALEGILLPSRSVVIIIHTVSERNLPSITSADNLSSYPEYSNITFIDMGFEQDRGIYDCDQNRKASLQLQAFVKEFYQHTT